MSILEVKNLCTYFDTPHGVVKAVDDISFGIEKGEVFGIKGIRCDGNDVIDIFNTAYTIIKKIREGFGPFLMECRTYRWKGHVGPDCDIEKGCRSKEEVDFWLKRCPIKQLEKILLAKKILTKNSKEALYNKIEKEINDAVTFAKGSPFSNPEEVYKDVYWKE